MKCIAMETEHDNLYARICTTWDDVMYCHLFIRELFASILETWLKFLAVDLCFFWVGIKPVKHGGIKIYGSPEFATSLISTITEVDKIDPLSGARIRGTLKYIAEGISKDNFVLLRSQGVLIGTNTSLQGNSAIAHQLIKAAISCRVYSGFHIWTSRMNACQSKRVRQLAMQAQRRLLIGINECEVSGIAEGRMQI